MSPDPYISHWDCTVRAHPGSPLRRRRRLVPRETYEEVMARLGLPIGDHGQGARKRDRLVETPSAAA